MKIKNLIILGSLFAFTSFAETTAVLDLKNRFYMTRKELSQNLNIEDTETKLLTAANILAEFVFKKGDLETLDLNFDDLSLLTRATGLVRILLQQSIANESIATSKCLRLEYTVDSGYKLPIKVGDGKFEKIKTHFQRQLEMRKEMLRSQADTAEIALQRKILEILEN